MSCNHKRRIVVVEGLWLRRKPSVVESDTVRVWRCEACGAIRLDQFNEFCYGQGVWSRPNRAGEVKP